MAIPTRSTQRRVLAAALLAGAASCGAQERPADSALAPIGSRLAEALPRAERLLGGAVAPWVLHMQGSDSDAARAAAVGPDGAVLVAGSFDGELALGSDVLLSAGESDGFVAALSRLGEPLWAQRIGGPGTDTASAVTVDADGNATVVGEFSGALAIEGVRLSARGRDLFIASFTRDGALRWATAWRGPGWDAVEAAASAPDGGILIAGTCGEVEEREEEAQRGAARSGDADGFLARIGPDGQPEWTVRLGGDDWDQAHAVAVASDGTIAVGGFFSGAMAVGPTRLVGAGRSDGFVAAFTGSGEPRWAARIGGPLDDAVTALAAAPDGTLAVAGRFADHASLGPFTLTSAGDADLFLALLEPGGRPRWAQRRGDASFDAAQAIAALGDGSILVAGAVGGELNPSAGGAPDPAPTPVASRLVIERYSAAGQPLEALHLAGSFVAAGGLAATGMRSAVLAGWFIRDVRVAGRTLESRGNLDGLVVALEL